VNRNTLALLQLIAMMIWCLALIAGAAIAGFIGLAFAGEPGSGAEVTGSEYLMAAAPLMVALTLTIGLITLWVKQHYKVALAIWLLSIIVILPLAYGYVV
jgi:hypothetical protein